MNEQIVAMCAELCTQMQSIKDLWCTNAPREKIEVVENSFLKLQKRYFTRTNGGTQKRIPPCWRLHVSHIPATPIAHATLALYTANGPTPFYHTINDRYAAAYESPEEWAREILKMYQVACGKNVKLLVGINQAKAEMVKILEEYF